MGSCLFLLILSIFIFTFTCLGHFPNRKQVEIMKCHWTLLLFTLVWMCNLNFKSWIILMQWRHHVNNCCILLSKQNTSTKIKSLAIYVSRPIFFAKVLFTDHCKKQNSRPSRLHLVNSCLESIYKKQKTRANVLPSVTVGE